MLEPVFNVRDNTQVPKVMSSMKLTFRTVTAGSILGGLLLHACLPARPQTPSSPKPPKQEVNVENTLAYEVRHQLQEVPYYSVFDYMSFSLNDNNVTLTGQVHRPTLRAHAETAVRSLEGVGTVVNNIEVIPATPRDHELSRNIYRVLFEDAILQKYAVTAVPSIHIIVKSGAVSLEGTVNSDADKTLAGNLAGKVPNILSLQNNLVLRKKKTNPTSRNSRPSQAE